jgi:hypothetical protein
LGAVTDLIVDGRVNTYRLERNLVGGAVAGGVAGAAAGHQQDVRAEQQRRAQAAAAADREPDRELVAKIGKDNYAALGALLNYRHEEAYRRALKATRSKNRAYQESGYVIQALVDKDRGHADGVQEAVTQFLDLNDTVKGEQEARKGLDDLYQLLEDERKVKGIRNPR